MECIGLSNICGKPEEASCGVKNTKTNYRIERDSLGEVQVPEKALYGAQPQRAGVLFHVSEKRPLTVGEIQAAFSDLRRLTEGGIIKV